MQSDSPAHDSYAAGLQELVEDAENLFKPFSERWDRTVVIMESGRPIMEMPGSGAGTTEVDVIRGTVWMGGAFPSRALHEALERLGAPHDYTPDPLIAGGNYVSMKMEAAREYLFPALDSVLNDPQRFKATPYRGR